MSTASSPASEPTASAAAVPSARSAPTAPAAVRRGERRGRRVRTALLWIHRWASLALGLLFFLLSVTGAALVYKHELDRALNPALFAVTPGDVGAGAVEWAVRRAFPSEPLVFLTPPAELHGVWRARIGEDTREVFVDPGTGRILGHRRFDDAFVNQLQTFHINLLAGEVGRAVVGASGIAMLAVTLTGLYLWWPGLRRWASTLRLRLCRGAYFVHYDVHNLLGVVTLPLVAVLALTGALLIFYDVGERLTYALLPGSRESSPRELEYRLPPLTTPAPALPADALLARGAAALPGGRAYTLYRSGSDERPSYVAVRRGRWDVRPNLGSSRVYLDHRTGGVVGVFDLARASVADRVNPTWLMALHFGNFAGRPLQLVYFVAGGLVPVALLVTGVAQWWIKRRRRAHAAARRS